MAEAAARVTTLPTNAAAATVTPPVVAEAAAAKLYVATKATWELEQAAPASMAANVDELAKSGLAMSKSSSSAAAAVTLSLMLLLLESLLMMLSSRMTLIVVMLLLSWLFSTCLGHPERS